MSGIFSDSSNVPSTTLGTEFAPQKRESAMKPFCQEKPGAEQSTPEMNGAIGLTPLPQREDMLVISKTSAKTVEKIL